MCVNVSVCQPPSETHRESASQTATALDLGGFVDASISSFRSFFSNLALCENVCQCVSVSASLRDPQGVCKSDKNCSGSMWLCRCFNLILSNHFFFKFSPLRECVSMCQCVSLPQRPTRSLQVRQQLLWI